MTKNVSPDLFWFAGLVRSPARMGIELPTKTLQTKYFTCPNVNWVFGTLENIKLREKRNARYLEV